MWFVISLSGLSQMVLVQLTTRAPIMISAQAAMSDIPPLNQPLGPTNPVIPAIPTLPALVTEIPPLPTLVIPPGWPGVAIPSIWPPPIPGVSATLAVPTDIPGVPGPFSQPAFSAIAIPPLPTLPATMNPILPVPPSAVAPPLPLPTVASAMPAASMIPGAQPMPPSSGMMPLRPSVTVSSSTKSTDVVVMADAFTDNKSSQVGTGLIVGLVIGCLAIVAAICGFILYRRRSQETEVDPEARFAEVKEATLRNTNSEDEYSYNGPGSINAVIVTDSKSNLSQSQSQEDVSTTNEQQDQAPVHTDHSTPPKNITGTLARMTVLTNFMKRTSTQQKSSKSESSPETPTPNGIRMSRPPSSFFNSMFTSSGSQSQDKEATSNASISPPPVAITRDDVRMGNTDVVVHVPVTPSATSPTTNKSKKQHSSVTFNIPDTSSTPATDLVAKTKQQVERRSSPLARKPVMSFSDEDKSGSDDLKSAETTFTLPEPDFEKSSIDLATSLLEGVSLDFKLDDFAGLADKDKTEDILESKFVSPVLEPIQDESEEEIDEDESDDDDDDKPLGTLDVMGKKTDSSPTRTSPLNGTSGFSDDSTGDTHNLYRSQKTSSVSLSSSFSLPPIVDSEGRPFSFLPSPHVVTPQNKPAASQNTPSRNSKSSLLFPTPPLTLASLDSMSESSSPEPVSPSSPLKAKLSQSKQHVTSSLAKNVSVRTSHSSESVVKIAADKAKNPTGNPGDSPESMNHELSEEAEMYVYPEDRVPYRYSSNF